MKTDQELFRDVREIRPGTPLVDLALDQLAANIAGRGIAIGETISVRIEYQGEPIFDGDVILAATESSRSENE